MQVPLWCAKCELYFLEQYNRQQWGTGPTSHEWCIVSTHACEVTRRLHSFSVCSLCHTSLAHCVSVWPLCHTSLAPVSAQVAAERHVRVCTPSNLKAFECCARKSITNVCNAGHKPSRSTMLGCHDIKSDSVCNSISVLSVLIIQLRHGTFYHVNQHKMKPQTPT